MEYVLRGFHIRFSELDLSPIVFLGIKYPKVVQIASYKKREVPVDGAILKMRTSDSWIIKSAKQDDIMLP